MPSTHRLRSAPLGLAIVALAALVAPACSTDAAGPPPSDPPAARTLSDPATTEALEAVVTDVVADLGVPGAVVLVTQGEQRWETAVGTAEIGSDIPLQVGLDWPLRSITKSFTVTLVLQLVDAGLIDLDDAIGAWIPDIPNGDQVTIGQLADMSSGLGDYTSDAFIEDFIAEPERWFTLDELIAYGLAEPVRAEPGDERIYTNLNTLLLGRLVEEVTGQPFDEALRERILVPNGLASTTYPVSERDGTDAVTGYSPDANGELGADPVNFSVFGPAGAMIATTDDLARWGRLLATGRVVGESSDRARRQAEPLDEGPTYDRYGLGIGELDGWWGHTGEGFGFTSLVMHDEVTDTTVVIVANASQLESHAPTTMFRQLAPLLG